MNPQVAQTPEGIADGEASSSEVKTYPTGKGHKGISTSRKKPSAFNTDQQQIGELKKNIRAYVRANGSQQELKLLQKALTSICKIKCGTRSMEDAQAIGTLAKLPALITTWGRNFSR